MIFQFFDIAKKLIINYETIFDPAWGALVVQY